MTARQSGVVAPLSPGNYSSRVAAAGSEAAIEQPIAARPVATMANLPTPGEYFCNQECFSKCHRKTGSLCPFPQRLISMRVQVFCPSQVLIAIWFQNIYYTDDDEGDDFDDNDDNDDDDDDMDYTPVILRYP